MEIKVPFYNIINMFLTGLVFAGGCVLISPEQVKILLGNEIIGCLEAGPEIVLTVCIFAVAYEVGLIINRAGSVIVEEFLKWKKWIPFNNDYVLFNEKKKKYPILSTLSREYALSRTGIALFLVLLILSLLFKRWELSVAFLTIVLIFYLSCRKHSSKIVELMNEGCLEEKN